jgi:hypothetical protein
MMKERGKLPPDATDPSSVFMLGLVLGASLPLLFLALA